MTDLSRMKPTSFFTGINKFKSAISTAILLVIVSFFIIGGCNDSGFNQTQEARTIGEIQGVIVPAVRAEFALQRWQEGDPDGNVFLNGSRVSGLTQSEQDALNNAYQSGFFVSLIDPETQDMQNLVNILGIHHITEDNRSVDLYAVSREFNVSGVRHFTMDSLEQVNEDNPPGLSFHRERLQMFTKWAADEDTVTTLARGVGSPEADLTMQADSTSHTKQWSFAPGIFVGTNLSLSDWYIHTQIRLEGWSVHSVDTDKDFYFFQIMYEFVPDTSLPRVQPGNLWPCQVQQGPEIPGLEGEYFYPRNLALRGSASYEGNNIVTDFASPVVENLVSEPKTTEGTVTTSSSISTSVGGSVSFSTEDGASVGLSESVTYDHSQSYSAPAVNITNESIMGPNENNAAWQFDLTEALNVATNTFQPLGQWELSADPQTRAGGFLNITTGFHTEFYLITCATNPGVVANLANPTPGSLVKWGLNFPVPPTPPPPTPAPTPPPTCTMGSCPVGQECATDLTPPVCVPQPCDESMTCPLGFDCINEVCEPET